MIKYEILLFENGKIFIYFHLLNSNISITLDLGDKCIKNIIFLHKYYKFIIL